MNKNDRQIILRFSYDDKMFYIFNSNNKLIYACEYEDGKMNFVLNSDEVELVTDVFKQLLIDRKSSCYVRDEKRNEKIYKIFYDSNTRNYFWRSSDDDVIFSLI